MSLEPDASETTYTGPLYERPAKSTTSLASVSQVNARIAPGATARFPWTDVRFIDLEKITSSWDRSWYQVTEVTVGRGVGPGATSAVRVVPADPVAPSPSRTVRVTS